MNKTIFKGQYRVKSPITEGEPFVKGTVDFF